MYVTDFTAAIIKMLREQKEAMVYECFNLNKSIVFEKSSEKSKMCI